MPEMRAVLLLCTLYPLLSPANGRAMRLLAVSGPPDRHNASSSGTGAGGRGPSAPSLQAMQTRGRLPAQDDVPLRPGPHVQIVTKKANIKKESCKTQPLKQVVRMKGCLKTKIVNHFCYGQCNSFFIPKTAKRDRMVDAFMSCGFCRPRHIQWVLVTLRCPTEHGMRYRRKHVQFVKKCRCMAQDVSLASFS